jgi:acetyl esterase/lipase
VTCDTLVGPPPAAPDDGFAAVQWITANADKLGGLPGKLAVAGWSAGANVAAVVCQTARNAGGPEIVGQMLLCPVTDCDFDRQSYIDNGDGYILTAELMKWFWDHYADPADRTNPKASPLLANDLSNLPPALVVTCESDPLSDEGTAYAEAMKEAGISVTHLAAPGQIHTSLTAVDITISGVSIREEMGVALRQFFGVSVPA